MNKTQKRNILFLFLFLILSFSASGIGSLFTVPEVPIWYAGLNKPAYSPPDWIFTPVWMTLYTLMSIAAWLVWRKVGFNSFAIKLFLLQLFLNLLWPIIFFGQHQIGWALVEILFLLLAIILTTNIFFKHNMWAGILMAPYIIWVAFATYLNFNLWRLNF